MLFLVNIFSTWKSIFALATLLFDNLLIAYCLILTLLAVFVMS